MLELLEERIVPDVELLDPVKAIRDISRDLSYRWEVQLKDGTFTTAGDIQYKYLELAEQHLRGQDAESDWVLDEWRFVLNALAYDPMSLVDRLDWVTKKWLLESFMVEEGLDWQDPWIQSLDLEYHNLNTCKGLYFDLREQGLVKRVLDDRIVEEAISTPPQNTRARARSKVMRKLTDHKVRCVIDWDSIYVEDEQYLNIDDPFLTYDIETAEFIAQIDAPIVT